MKAILLADFCVILLLLPSVAIAQAQVLETGARIRVTLTEEVGVRRHNWRIAQEGATFVGFSNDSLILATKSRGHLSLPLSRVKKLEVSHDRRSFARLGAGVGMLSGGLIVGYLVLKSKHTYYQQCETYEGRRRVATDGNGCFAPGLNVVLGTSAGVVIGTIAGGMIGAAVGWSHSRHRWADVPLSERVVARPIVRPEQGGIILSF